MRKYGNPPYRIAVLHGGPGAPGEVAPLASELSGQWGTLEPWQTQASIDGQIEELQEALNEYAELPAVIIGFSWGAWLGCLFAARYPSLTRKLILVGSGPFEEYYAESITATRLKRLTEEEKEFIINFNYDIKNPSGDKENNFQRFARLMEKTDAYDPLAQSHEDIPFQPEIYTQVWHEANLLRQNGGLLRQVKKIQCPITAIHGSYDPHPYAGVFEPLSRLKKDFKSYLLEKCGHKPWIEKQARKEFYAILRQELEGLFPDGK